MEKQNFKRIETKLVHSGVPSPRILGAVSIPIFQSAMYETAGEGSYHDIKYIRLNNTPNHEALRRKLAVLEGAEDALVTASGMAAISTTLLTDLGEYGISYDFIDAVDGQESWKSKLKPNTKSYLCRNDDKPAHPGR